MFCTVAPYICGSSAWNFFPITLLAPRIFGWLLNFWKILCAPTVAHYDFQLKQRCEFVSFLISEVDGSVLVGYCASLLGDWCPTFRDSMMVPKRLDLITYWCGCIFQENGDLNSI
jgi:hypothetical protein